MNVKDEKPRIYAFLAVFIGGLILSVLVSYLLYVYKYLDVSASQDKGTRVDIGLDFLIASPVIVWLIVFTLFLFVLSRKE